MFSKLYKKQHLVYMLLDTKPHNEQVCFFAI